MRNINGRLSRLENLLQKRASRGISAASRRFIEIEIAMAYNPWHPEREPLQIDPDELAELEQRARAADPEFWQQQDYLLDKAYGPDQDEYLAQFGV